MSSLMVPVLPAAPVLRCSVATIPPLAYGVSRSAAHKNGGNGEQSGHFAHFCCTATSAAADWQTPDGLSMIPKSGHRFSEKIMLQQ
jgi:hypothetical protein